jgi:hypothetical protein
MSRWMLFRLNAASFALHEDIRTFYCYRRYKFAIKHFYLFWNTRYFYIVDSDEYLNDNTEHIAAFSLQQWLR